MEGLPTFSVIWPRCAICRIIFSTPRAFSGFTSAMRDTAVLGRRWATQQQPLPGRGWDHCVQGRRHREPEEAASIESANGNRTRGPSEALAVRTSLPSFRRQHRSQHAGTLLLRLPARRVLLERPWLRRGWPQLGKGQIPNQASGEARFCFCSASFCSSGFCGTAPCAIWSKNGQNVDRTE